MIEQSTGVSVAVVVIIVSASLWLARMLYTIRSEVHATALDTAACRADIKKCNRRIAALVQVERALINASPMQRQDKQAIHALLDKSLTSNGKTDQLKE